VASPEAAAELTRKYSQNRNDIEFLHELLEATNETVKATKTLVKEHTARFDQVDARFDQVDARFDRVDARFDGIDSRLDGVDTRFDRVDARFDGLDTRVDGLETKFDGRFDRLEALITGRSASQPTTGVMRTPQERKVSVLESRMDVYSSQTAEARFELERHNQMFDAYDDRFNTLDSQMTEVLGILRGTGS
jgi:archaellum component FlaC